MAMTMTMPMPMTMMARGFFCGREPGGWDLSALAKPKCGVKVGRLDRVSTAARPRDKQAWSEVVVDRDWARRTDSQTDRR